MKLIIHCGLNKAGSTYLQNIFVESQHELKRHGIFYPEPHDSGIGNAGMFALALKALDRQQAKSHFDRFYRAAKEEGCDVLLMSSEYFFFQVINPKQKSLLTEILNYYKISGPELVIVFRPITEHAISAYSHRCGTIKLPKFEDWIKGDIGEYPSLKFSREINRKSKFWYDGYEFWDSSAKLLSVIELGEFSITPIQYSMNLKKDFDELLGVSLIAPKSKKFNKSMTLNQAEMCRILFDVRKDWGSAARAFFKSNQDIQVSDDSALKIKYNDLVLQAIEDHLVDIELLEMRLGITLRSPQESIEGAALLSPRDNVMNLQFSEFEIKGVIAKIEKSESSKTFFRMLLRKLKSLARLN